MATTTGHGTYQADAEMPLLQTDLVRGSVDFKGRPSVRSKSGCWRAASFIVVVEMAERICYYGISSNMMSYLTRELGQSTAAAAANLNSWYGTAALTPILGAFLADSFLGRYRTAMFSSLLYILGLGCLTLSAALKSFYSSDCKSAARNLPCSPPAFQTIFFFCSLYLVALAQGGHRPCLPAFGADQFDVEDEKEFQAQSSFFNWSFWFSCLGILLVLLFLSYVQENLSWELGFGIPAMLMCVALIVFLLGTMSYRFNGQPAVAAVCNEREAQQILPHEHAEFEFSRTALLAPDDGSMEDKKVYSNVMQQAKAILKLAPIWCTSLGYSIMYAQPSTLFTKQAATLDRHISSSVELPAASLQLWIIISIMVVIPIYDYILVPIAKAATKKPTGLSMLQRIGIGLCLSLTSSAIAAVVENKRLANAREYGLVDMPQTVIPMSVWWLVPQYVLSGTADVFTMIGLQQFFYDQVPAELKSIGMALFLSILGVGSFLSSILVFVVDKVTRGIDDEGGWFSDNLNRAHLDYFYWILFGLGAFSLAFYLHFAKSYVYK